MRIFFLLILLMAVSTTKAFAKNTYTLDECFTAALQKSELIGTQIELVNQAEETYRQTKGAILPTISATASYQRLAAPPAAFATFNPSEQTNAKITATQPLFRGFREFAAISQQNLQWQAAIEAKKQAATQLYNDVSTNFYSVLSLEQILKDLQHEIDIDQERIKELDTRIRLGKSQKSEVLTIISAVDTLAAQLEATRGQLSAMREVFVFLTGLDKKTILQEQDPSPAQLVGPVESYLAEIENRPDVHSAKESSEATEKGISIAQGGHLPSVDLVGDYWIKRAGILQDQHWDAMITGTLPIFSGGITQSQVRQAVSVNKASELNLSRVRRLADQEIRTNHSNVVSDIAQVEKLQRATKSAIENYNVQSRYYKLGLVTNLDVLLAITTSQQSQRTLDSAAYQAKLDMVKLETSIAKRPKPGQAP